MNLAFYGTLRDPDILAMITGDELLSQPFRILTVPGWACLRIEGAAYPLLRSDPSASTIFHLYHDCSEVSWRRLLEYEGDEYDCSEIEIEAQTYRVFMGNERVSASHDRWDLESFQTHYKEQYQNSLLGS